MKLTTAMACLILVLLPTFVPASTDHIRDAGPFTTVLSSPNSRPNVIFWYDQVEDGDDGWTHADLTADAEPHFHVDSNNALPGGSYSYWCGVLDPSFAGGSGYGNSWDQRLELPPVYLGGTPVEDVSWGELKSLFRDGDPESDGDSRGPILPMLTFAYRHDSELNYDFTWVQAESAGTWVDLNDGYTGSSGGWQDCGGDGFSLAGFGDPARVRFRFLSDGAWSDEDGRYTSDGGAFHVDNLRVFDFATGEVYFYDDCEDGVGLCEAAIPPAAGDWWHIIDRSCPAFSDPHSWWCGDDSDTSLIPPGLRNELCTPLVDISGAQSCSVHFAAHFAIPIEEGDYVQFQGMSDGSNYYTLGSYWGDSGQCAGWNLDFLVRGFDLGQFSAPPWGLAGFKFIFHSNDDGCGPGAAGDAGITIDDIWMEGYPGCGYF